MHLMTSYELSSKKTRNKEGRNGPEQAEQSEAGKNSDHLGNRELIDILITNLKGVKGMNIPV